MKKKAGHILLFSIIPVFISGLIYVFSRPESLVVFKWLDFFGFIEIATAGRKFFSLNEILPDWIIYNTPALIWSFSFSMVLGVIWNYDLRIRNILFFMVPAILGAISEILQKMAIIPGVYDGIDLSLYFIGSLVSIPLLRYCYLTSNNKSYE